MAQDTDYCTKPIDTGDRLPAWHEWKARCARGLCASATQTTLAAFAGQRFKTYIRRYAAHTGIQDAWQITRQYPPDDAWHLFESHLCARNTPGGKHYKDWLFTRMPAKRYTPLQAIEAGVSIILRDVVRRRLADDYAPANCLSLEVEFCADKRELPTAPTVFLAQPGPLDEAAAREYAQLALGHAQQAFDGMTDRERVTVLCRDLGLPFSDPAVSRAAQCSKSALHDAYEGFFVRMARWMQETYPDDDTESVMGLTLMLIHGIKDRLKEWARHAGCCAGLRSRIANP